VEFNTLSKTYNMAGWRVAAAVGSAEALRLLFTLKSNQDSGQFLPVQQAAEAALTGDQAWVEERNQVYAGRRDLVVQALRDAGLAVQTPRASLYVWSPIPPGWTSAGFCQSLLEEAHVSLTPGTLFGEHGEGFVRISFTAPGPRIDMAMRRMRDWLAARSFPQRGDQQIPPSRVAAS
jgi:LL-diaminopimelate aminotransferase